MAETQTIVNCCAVLPDRIEPDCAIVVEAGRIAALGPRVPPQGEILDAGGLLALPGFVDAHVHGAVGHDFNQPSVAAVEAVLRAHASHGTTALLASIYTDHAERMLQAIETLANLPQPEDGAELLGVYIEGPFLNKARRGAQPEEAIVPPDPALLGRMLAAGRGKVRVLALSPELPGALELIRFAVQSGVRVSMAHTDATYAQVQEAVAAGLSHVTHLFDGMRGLHHREPGPVGAALLLEQLEVELIGDGLHVLPEIVNLTLRLKGVDKVMLVSDALHLAGLPPGRYQFAGQPAEVGNGWAKLTEAGTPISVCTMQQAFRNAASWTGLPLPQLSRLTSLNPARAAGAPARKGSLETGKDADILLMDDQFNLREVFLRGRRLTLAEGESA